MRFDRLEKEGRDRRVGRVYWLDLRLIREAKGIAIKTVHQRTRVPVEILSSFEEEGLADRRRFNNVYRRSLAAAYARAIEIDPDDVLRSAEESELGRYRGRLACNYLGMKPPPPKPENEGIGADGLGSNPGPGSPPDKGRTPTDLNEESDTSWPEAIEPLAIAFSSRPFRVIVALIAALLIVWLIAALI